MKLSINHKINTKYKNQIIYETSVNIVKLYKTKTDEQIQTK